MVKYNVLRSVCQPKQKVGDAAMDMRIAKDVRIAPGEIVMVELGVSFNIPLDQYVEITERSSTAMQGVISHTGTIDASFNGKECKAILFNIGRYAVTFKRGERVVQAKALSHRRLEETIVAIDSGDSKEGFGSSGRD